MISTTTQRISYSGDGIDDTFAIPFRWDDDTWIEVYVDDILLTLDTDYTLSGEGEDNGGTAVFTIPPPVGTDNVVILRATPLTQVERLTSTAPFPSRIIERQMFDKLQMQIHDIHEILARCPKFDVFSTFRDIGIEDPQAGRLLRYNGTADRIEGILISGLEISAAVTVETSVIAGSSTVVVTHALGSLTARIIGFSSTWLTEFRVASQTADTITLEFGTECPPGGGTIFTEVSP